MGYSTVLHVVYRRLAIGRLRTALHVVHGCAPRVQPTVQGPLRGGTLEYSHWGASVRRLDADRRCSGRCAAAPRRSMPSIHPSVRPSVRPSVAPNFGRALRARTSARSAQRSVSFVAAPSARRAAPRRNQGRARRSSLMDNESSGCHPSVRPCERALPAECAARPTTSRACACLCAA